MYVYHISDTRDLATGYVGVTKRLKHRWSIHLKSKYTVGQAIRDFGWTFEENMHIIFTGTPKECFALEKTLRPYPSMGLNEAIGGGSCDVYTGLSDNQKQTRNGKISAALKGREIKWKDKVSKTRIDSGVAKGSNNPNSKTWTLFSPDGTFHECNGNLQQFCDEHNLLLSSLRYHTGEVVPAPQNNALGGYRAKSEESRRLRYNTTGWKLLLAGDVRL